MPDGTATLPVEPGRVRRPASISTVDATRALLAVYADPRCAPAIGAEQWMAILGACRRARCLGHLASRLAHAGVIDRIEPRLVEHLQSAAVVIARQRRALLWELRELAEALEALPHPVVALKGSAYLLADLPLAAARVASDVDLLVPPDGLAAIEARLKGLGWQGVELTDYDDRYYREWSHEIPALTHPSRGIEVDVHHSIAPGVPGDGPAARGLIEASRPVRWTYGAGGAWTDRFRLPSPTDQLVHVAVHSFSGSELAMRLREVMDFDLLFRHWCVERQDSSAAQILARAEEFGLARPTWWMMHYAVRWLGTPVPPEALAGGAVPSATLQTLMDGLVDRSMLPGLRQRRTHREFAAELALLGRYQWQRLPLRRLVPHVLEKARRRLLDREN
jgi:hypothetical protein